MKYNKKIVMISTKYNKKIKKEVLMKMKYKKEFVDETDIQLRDDDDEENVQ